MGNGATAEIDRALHAKLDDVAYPVYVVLTATPPGFGGRSPDQELATLVHDRLGDDGVYFVETSQGDGHLAVYGDIDPAERNDDTAFSLARYTGMDQVTAAVAAVDETLDVPAVTEAGVVLDVAGNAAIPDYSGPVLSDAQVATYAGRPWTSVGFDLDADDTEPVSVGLGALVGVTVGLVVAVLAYRLLRASVGAAAEREVAEAAASKHLEKARSAAHYAIEQLDADLVEAAGGDARETASICVEVARELTESDDLLDLVGAQVLARTGSRVLEPGEAPYRCCYVDPRHGGALYDADIGGGLSVPVCKGCQRALDSGTGRTPLQDRGRPWFEGDSVWARTGYGLTSDALWDDVRRERSR